MARASRTGIRGLFKAKDGTFNIDLRWREPGTGEARRYREAMPAGITAAAAKMRAREILAAALAGGFDPKHASEPKRLGKALDAYEEWAKVNRPKTLRDRKSLGRAIRAALGEEMRLDELCPFTVERLKKARKDAKAEAATINRCTKMLKHAVGLWATWGWMSKERAAEVRAIKNLPEPPGRVRHLSEDEETRFMAALAPRGKQRPDSLRIIATAALQSGMRLGELATLKKDAVDLEGRLISLADPKGGGVETVHVNDALAAVLKEAMALSGKSEFVFTSRTGKPYKAQSLSRMFGKAIKKANIPNFRFHDTRHTTATRIRAKGVGIDVIAEVLRHKSLAMAKRYTHLGPGAISAAMATLPPPVAPAVKTAEKPAPIAHPLPIAGSGDGEKA